MDPTITVNVLLDQVVPTEDEMDEEDQAVRDRLRALVLEFMKGRAKHGIIRNANAQRSEPEVALVSRILNVRLFYCSYMHGPKVGYRPSPGSLLSSSIYW